MSEVKIVDLVCQYTGTNDKGTFDANAEECKRCQFVIQCQIVFKEDELQNARDMYLEGQKMIAEGEQLIKDAKGIFERQSKSSGVLKFQYTSLVYSWVTVKAQNTYPKERLEQFFTSEQLKPCLVIKPSYSYSLITNLLKEKKTEK